MAVAPRAMRLPIEFEVRRRLHRHDVVLSRMDLSRALPGRAIDVGANTGSYSYAFSRVFDRVDAFEPQPWCAAAISDFARKRERVRVHRLGLSDRAGQARLYVPIVAGRWHRHLATGLGSIRRPAEGPVRRVDIDLIPLDAFGFDDVSVIKIDVEGHEREVLAGARETIARCTPALIVEIEQRHLPAGTAIADIFSSITSAGYRGWSVAEDGIHAIEEFRVERDQVPFAGAVALGERAPAYINNFLFTATKGRAATLAATLFRHECLAAPTGTSSSAGLLLA